VIHTLLELPHGTLAATVRTLAVALPGTTAAAGAPGTQVATGSTTPEGVPVPALDWNACDGGFECATADVRRDYARPRGATVRLALIRHQAVDAEHRIGTLCVNPGSPGSSGIDFVRHAPPVAFQALSRFDWGGLRSPRRRRAGDRLRRAARAVHPDDARHLRPAGAPAPCEGAVEAGRAGRRPCAARGLTPISLTNEGGVHNPTERDVSFRKKVVIAGRREEPGPVSEFFDPRLGPDQALEIDCRDIREHAPGGEDFLKGFVVIESDIDLDIVGVYTAAGDDGQVRTLDVERVRPRGA
jgi:hypothetical protein